MWHVMCYFGGYRHPFAVHIFKSEKPSREEAVASAELLLTILFPEWRGGGPFEGAVLNYVGYEELPFDIDDTYYVVVKLEKDDLSGGFRVVEHYSSVPEELAEKILNYRLSHLTLDYDRMSDHEVFSCVEAMKRFGGTLYRTHRGYHLRAPLPRRATLEELLKLREKYQDDWLRLRIDRAYAEAGLGFLTNFLFNEKHWRDELGGEWLSYREVKVDKPEFVVEKLILQLPPTTPPFTLKHEKGVIEVRGNVATFRGVFSREDVERMVSVVVEEARRRIEEERRRQPLRDTVASLMARKSPRAARLLRECEVRERGGVVLIHVPEHLREHAGLIIGRGGANVKFLEAELGKRVKVIPAGGRSSSESRSLP